MTAPDPDDLLRLDVHGRRMGTSVGAAARSAAEAIGFPAADAERVGAVAVRLCDALATRDFDDPRNARYTVALRARPAALALEVSDGGLPTSLGGQAGTDLVHALLGPDGADRAQVSSTGDSNTATVEIRRDPAALDHLVDEETPVAEAPEPEVRVSRLERSHLESLARCTWRVYGHTYVADFLYHPEETWRMVEDGRLHSVVALVGDEVVGHVAIEQERAGDRVGDSTLAFTDPRYRGHHILRATQAQREAIALELGLMGTLAEAVTPHTITQRTRVEAGAVETGILLGFIPSSMTYRGFSSDVQGTSRQSAVLSYEPLAPAPHRRVFAPEPYAEVLAERYAAMGIDRTLAPAGPVTGPTEVDVALDGPRSLAALEVASVGADAASVIDHHRRRLCAAGTDIVYAELPLGDPGTPAAVDGLRDRGFAYAGFVPEQRGGDVLRMQYLDVEVDTDIIQLYTDDARRLLEITLAERA